MQNDHSIALGLLHISKGYSIKATTMDDIVVRVTDDDSDGFKFETIIKKRPRFSYPLLPISHSIGKIGNERGISDSPYTAFVNSLTVTNRT